LNEIEMVFNSYQNRSPSWRQRRNRRAEKGLRGAEDLGREAEATEDGGAGAGRILTGRRRTGSWWRRTTRRRMGWRDLDGKDGAAALADGDARRRSRRGRAEALATGRGRRMLGFEIGRRRHRVVETREAIEGEAARV
jgi:hypothetical protein